MRGVRSSGALLIAVLVRCRLTYRIGKSLQRPQRTTYALVFLATDSSVEKDRHSRCAGHVDDVHFDAPFCVFSLCKTVGCGRLFPNLSQLRGRLLSNSGAIKTTALRLRRRRVAAGAGGHPAWLRSRWFRAVRQKGTAPRDNPGLRSRLGKKTYASALQSIAACGFPIMCVLATGCRLVTMPSPAV